MDKNQNQMTPGQALDWMIEHPGMELVDGDGCKYQMPNGYLFKSLDGNGRTVPLSSLLRHTFRVPERILPKLPDGCHWKQIGILDEEGTLWFKARNQLEREIHAAMVEEFDTRPR